MAIADRWFPKPEVLGTVRACTVSCGILPGALPRSRSRRRWRLAATQPAQGIARNISAASYGRWESKTQRLQVVMDPRSPATAEVLEKQYETGRRIYDEAMVAYPDISRDQVGSETTGDRRLRSGIAGRRAQIGMWPRRSLLSQGGHEERADSEGDLGLQDAYRNIASALRVAEGGDRAAPAGALTFTRNRASRLKPVCANGRFSNTQHCRR